MRTSACAIAIGRDRLVVNMVQERSALSRKPAENDRNIGALAVWGARNVNGTANLSVHAIGQDGEVASAKVVGCLRGVDGHGDDSRRKDRQEN